MNSLALSAGAPNCCDDPGPSGSVFLMNGTNRAPQDPAQVMDLIDKRQRDRHALVIDAEVLDEVMN
jgi:hypothetical protein